MSYFLISGVLAAAVANGGTVALGYPLDQYGSPSNLGTFTGGTNHKLNLNQGNYVAPKDFSIVPGASTIVVTNSSGATWPAGSPYTFQLNSPGTQDYVSQGYNQKVKAVQLINLLVNLGAPVVGAANSIALSQAQATPGTTLTLSGANSGILDVPRNVVAAWTGTAIATVTGVDTYGKPLVEVSASGTSLTGKKAFAKVTSVTFNAAVTGATVGTGNVLGIPVFVPGAASVRAEIQDGSNATAGTIVAGAQTAGGSTGTTNDVRGTYLPNATPDGAKSFQLIVSLADPGYLGMPQYTV